MWRTAEVILPFFNLQFAINTSKASRPRRTPGTALPVRKAARVQAVTCLAQLAQPRKAWENPGRDSDHHSPAVTQATPTPTLLSLSKKKKME